MRKSSALGAVVALLVLLPALGADFAYASIKGVASTSSPVAVSSASWSVVAVPATAPSTNTHSAYTFATTGGTLNNFFLLVNFGTLSTRTVTITLSATLTGSSKTVQLQKCSTTWDAAGNCTSGATSTLVTVCSGGKGTCATNNGQAFSYSIPLPVGSSIQLRLLDNETSPHPKAGTVSVAIARTDVGAATTINS